MGMSVTQIKDLVDNTLPAYDRYTYTDLMMAERELLVLPKFFRTKRITETGGDRLEWDLATDTAGTAEDSELYDTDTVKIKDVFAKPHAEWTFQKAHFAFDVREKAMNRGMRAIQDVVRNRRDQMMIDQGKMYEERIIGRLPATGETKRPLSIWTYICPAAVQGFNGSDPGGRDSAIGAANILVANEDRWQNWTDVYTQYTEADLLYKIRLAVISTHFKAPISTPDNKYPGDERSILMTTNSFLKIGSLLEQRNDKLGWDMSPANPTYNMVPVETVPWWDDHTPAVTDPIMGIDWTRFRFVFQQGWFMKGTDAIRWPEGHNVFAVWKDNSMQTKCTNRRNQWVMYDNS